MKVVSLVAAGVVTASLAGCSSGNQGPAPLSGSAAASVSAASASSEGNSGWAEASASDNPGSGAVMPDEVGQVLQTAQDDLQRVLGNPLFISFSKDATGAARHQIVDRDWVVCAQDVAPGAPLNSDTRVTFSVVKIGETCP